MLDPKIVIRKHGEKFNVDIRGDGETVCKMMENAFVHIIHCAKIPGASFEQAMEVEFMRLRDLSEQYEKAVDGGERGNVTSINQ